MSLFAQVRRGVYAEFGLEIVNEPELIGFREAALADYFSLTNDKK
jgi:UDP-N-acetylenolpyruvoylglucosamine reductase